jgi:N-methylhydantoinase B
VRVPVRVFGDLRVQLSACHIAERQFLDLVAQYGSAGVERHMAELIAYSERMTRAALRELPDGRFTFEDWIDDDGIDIDRPIRLFCTVVKEGGRIVIDWTGTSPQVQGRDQ